jgi:hypothetical protein
LFKIFNKKLWQKSAKTKKTMIKKPLQNHQKQRLGAAINALKNPIFST